LQDDEQDERDDAERDDDRGFHETSWYRLRARPSSGARDQSPA
jgi:hypothetical protein